MTERLSTFLHDDDKYEQMLHHGDEIIIDFHDWYNFDAELARSLIEKPGEFFTNAKDLLDGLGISKPVRVANLVKTTSIRGIASADIGKLIQIDVVVMKATIPYSTPTEAHFECSRCGETLAIEQTHHRLKTPSECKTCGSRRGFALLLGEGTYIDTQELGLQERPEELPPGQVPEPLEATLIKKLVRTVSPGDRVKVTGVVKLRERGKGEKAFPRTLEVNHIKAYNRSYTELEITEEQIKRYKALSTKPGLEEYLIVNYAPSIYGWKHVKKALLWAQFGGIRKVKGGITTRGDINVLMVGDPGTGKTQLLLYSAQVNPRGIYADGGGVSGVGLTAALTKEGDRYVLSAGTMALADMGMSCIDEMDKMGDEDRNKIHPAMEQGIITIHKADVHATLNSRCSTLAACNPTDGRYNVYKTIPENVKKFPPSLLSRFDFIFIFLDKAEEEQDRLMADRILQIEVEGERDLMTMEDIKGYIAYAKTINPTLSKEIKIRIRDYFTDKRKHQADDVGLFITPRQLETLERSIEARARLHLRTEAIMEDAESAIELFEIFINETCQDPYTGKIDIDIVSGGIPKSLSKQSNRLPLVVELMIEELDGERDYVFKEAIIKFIMREWKVPKTRAIDIIALAEKKDLIWVPYMDHVKLS